MESNKLLTKIRKKRIAVVIVMVAVIFLITYFVFPLYFMLSKQNIKNLLRLLFVKKKLLLSSKPQNAVEDKENYFV